jgi:tetratricopeptide (TPR) repeat protein
MASSAGSALSLIKAMLELVADRRTGVLDVRSDGLRTQIYFDDGRPLFADDEALGETFGRLLMRQGVISNEQFVRVIDEMTRAALGNSQLRFGEVAVGLGVLTNEQVERGLAEQVCGIIARSLQRGESQWTFEPSPTAAKPPRSFSLEINPAVLEAARQSSDRSVVADVVAARPEEFVMVAGSRPASDLRDEGGGAAAATRSARMFAEQAFQRGMALIREAKMASAAIELRRASQLQPESLEYQLYAAWARARSHREIPSEVDQQMLLELAQKAKKRDPTFAFGSYVIGQLSMWAGDDEAAKKWFYEALRLDPDSDAGKQVRILARRRAATAAPPGGAGLPHRDEAAEPAPVAVSEPPVPAAPGVQPSRAASSRRARRLVPGAVLFGMGVLVIGALSIFAVARRSEPGAGFAPSVSPPPSLSVDAAAPVAVAAPVEQKETPAPVGPDAAPPGSGPGEMSEKKPLKPTGETDQDDAQMGTVLLPARAAGHRIFVDGRRAKTDGSEPLRLRCGQHVIQIGSGGAPEPIDLPCRGEVQLQ